MDSEIDFPRESGRLLSFTTDGMEAGIKIIDHIERRECLIKTSGPVSPRDISDSEFHFPIDRGIRLFTKSLTLPYGTAAYIRNSEGLMISELANGDTQEFPPGNYNIELPTPIKLYVVIQTNFEVEIRSDEVIIDSKNPADIYIGARSHHERPAATIKTDDTPENMMRAISCLGSALKTTTCERSYPTLRGHPPKIEMSDELNIPSVIEKPETGVSIEIPKDYRSIFVISPLVYYFSANVIAGHDSKIITEDGFEYHLDNTNQTFEREVERILKQCFFLDCITRTEGYYQVQLQERDEIENHLNIDFSSLYDKPLRDQIKTYLGVPFDKIQSYIPRWKLSAYVECDKNNINSLPFLINDLSIIYSAEKTDIDKVTQNVVDGSESRLDSNKIGEFTRQKPDTEFFRNIDDVNNGAFVNRSGGSTSESNEYIHINKNESMEQTWVGEGIPVGASKAKIQAFQNLISRTPTDGDIDITVVVNDEKMNEEGTVVNDIYDSREQLSFRVEEYQQLTIEKLREVLHDETDFLHYIGHIDDEGFKCNNGKLDITKIDTTGIDSFLLNACSSYKQAISLVEKGAIAGIATLKPVLNSGAERIGEAIARLLNLGFPLIAALEIAKSESIMGDNYITIGNGGLDLTQAKSGIPSLCEIYSEGKDYTLIYKTYLTRRKNIGSMTMPYTKNNNSYYLTSGETGRFVMDINELLKFLSEENLPVIVGSELHWSDEITVKELRKLKE